MELANGFNLIEQCSGLNAWPLLKALLKSGVKTCIEEVIIYSDRLVHLTEWDFLSPSVFHVVDMNANCFKDLSSKGCFFAQLDDCLNSLNGEQPVVILDCLESLLMCHGTVESIQMLHRLFSANSRCTWVIIVSVEEKSDDFLAQLRSMARKVHQLSLEGENKHPVYCEIRHNIVKNTWDFQVNCAYDFTSTKRRVAVKKNQTLTTDSFVGAVPVLPREIESGVPFRLGLSPQEWEARSKVKLPYKKEANIRNDAPAMAKSSKIHYIAEVDDDIDDEDPDDDLDF